jgi:Leucine-rich repeat (LRR) protein
MELAELEKYVERAVKRGDKVVNLSHRSLTVITNSLARLTSAKLLTLNDNRLIMPPSELTSLISLEELVLDHNQLSMLPQGIGNLHRLRYVCLF